MLTTWLDKYIVLYIPIVAYQAKYLGLRTFVGRNKSNAFEFLKDYLCKQAQGWKQRFIPKVRKEILIKAVG